MRKVISVLVSFVLLFSISLSNVRCQAASKPTDFVYEVSYSEVIITEYKGTGGAVIIPGTLAGYPVVSIGDFAFGYDEKITSVVIPDGITSIGDYAFNGCANMTSVSIPNSVTTIGAFAFEGCGKLTSVTLPDNLFDIGIFAFSECTLSSITIPSTVVNIGLYAFDSNPNLANINVAAGSSLYSSIDGVLFDKDGKNLIKYPQGKTLESYSLPDGVTAISFSAFEGSNQLKSIQIPDSVTKIDEYAFARCSNLESITLPNSITELAAGMFSRCVSLANISIPDTVETIRELAFADCTMLSSINFPDGVKIIGDSAFSDCTGLLSITFSESITNIGYEAFTNCIKITEITIPKSIKRIDYYAFMSCSALLTINVNADNKYYSDADGVLFDKTKEKLIQYPAAKQGAYFVPDTVVVIEDSSFYRCYGLTNVTIPGSVLNIIGSAFYDCKNLTGITLSDGLKSIGVSAFGGCRKLTSVSLPKSVKVIDSSSFAWCNALTAFNVDHESTYFKSISGVLFSKDKKHLIIYPISKKGSSYIIPNTVTNIGYEAFSGCINLTSVTISKSVSEIDMFAFEGCKKLNRAYFLGNAPKASYMTFYDCVKDFKMFYVYGKMGYTSVWNGQKTSPYIPRSSVKAVKASSKSIKVSWSSFKYASSYQVYRATSANGTYKFVKKTTALNIVDKELKTGKTYYYKMRAIRNLAKPHILYGQFSLAKSVKL
ncbi:MAG: leucine-rich repeat protein [Clostridia bacterium]